MRREPPRAAQEDESRQGLREAVKGEQGILIERTGTPALHPSGILSTGSHGRGAWVDGPSGRPRAPLCHMPWDAPLLTLVPSAHRPHRPYVSSCARRMKR